MKARRRVWYKRIFLFQLLISVLFFGTIFSADFFAVKKNIINNSWKKIGFIYIQPSFLLRNVGYNSNVFYYENESVPDWTADVGIETDFSVLLGNRFIVRISESPYYSFFLENSNLNYMNNVFKAELYTYLRSLHFNFSYTLRRGLTRPSIEFGEQIKSRIEGNQISIDMGRHDKFYLSLSLSQERFGAGDDVYSSSVDYTSRLNKLTRKAEFKINRLIFTRTFLFGKVEYFEDQFEFDKNRDGTGMIYALGIILPEISIIKGVLEGGLKKFTPSFQMAEKYSKPYGSGNVSLRLSNKIKLGFKYTIDNFYSFYESDLYFDQRSYRFSLSYYLSRGIKIGYSFFSGEMVYKRLNGIKTGRIDNLETSEFNVGFRISGDMEIGIRYTDYFSDSTSIDFRRSYNFIGGYFNHEF